MHLRFCDANPMVDNKLLSTFTNKEVDFREEEHYLKVVNVLTGILFFVTNLSFSHISTILSALDNLHNFIFKHISQKETRFVNQHFVLGYTITRKLEP